MSKLIQIDGTSGGGQMLRTALSLAMITGQPFRMTGIRGGRPKPGLMRQHLTCVKAACEISGGTADGAEIGSTELVFRAGEVRGGSYQFAIGTAGSTSLLYQTLLPALLLAREPGTLRLEGGTHNPMAPPFEFLDGVFLPALRRMGAEVDLRLLETGFAPAGGGVIESVIRPCAGLRPPDLHQRGAVKSVSARAIIRGLPETIAEKMLSTIQDAVPCDHTTIERREPGPGKGVACQIFAECDHSSEMSSALGEFGVTSEKVGFRAAKSMRNFLASGLPVWTHLADQLLLPMALAGGGSFSTTAPDRHVPTNISVIEKFLPVKFRIDQEDRGRRVIRAS